jgi:hypothetical protein
MRRRLALALLLSAWLVAGFGCGSSGPVEQTKPVKQLRPRMPQEPTKG